MLFKSKLNSLILANCLPAFERAIADALVLVPQCEEFLKEAAVSDVILTMASDLPDLLKEKILKNDRIRFCLLPTQILDIMSISPMETSKQSSLAVCSLIKKVFRGTEICIRGVLTVYTGVAVNSSAAPGALIWKLKRLNFIQFHVSSIRLVIAMSFADSFTMMPKLRSLVFYEIVEEGLRTPDELMNAALQMVADKEQSQENVKSILELTSAMVPEAYHKRK